MATGKVKWFDEKRGFGFIVDGETNEDVFVHYSQINGSGYRALVDGAEVDFDRKKGPNGAFAENVTKVGS